MKLNISNHEYLIVHTEELENTAEYKRCADLIIEYINTQTDISFMFGNEQAQNFCCLLLEYKRGQELLDNKKKIDPSIKDIGLEWNLYFNGNIKQTNAFDYRWTCNDHKQIRPYYNSWLYNDENGNIILEITPFYPWHNVNKRTQPNRISFKEWIKSYKSTVKTIIPKENFKKWIEIIQELQEKYDL